MSGARARQSSIFVNIQDIFTQMAIQTHPIIASWKRQLKCERCAKMGHTIESCPLNYETVQDADSAAIRDCFR